MNNSEKVISSEPPSFEEILDETCERLWDKKREYVLRRLRELDDNLSCLEQEVEDHLNCLEQEQELEDIVGEPHKDRSVTGGI
jgi:hypothetical protein